MQFVPSNTLQRYYRMKHLSGAMSDCVRPVQKHEHAIRSVTQWKLYATRGVMWCCRFASQSVAEHTLHGVSIPLFTCRD